MTWEKEVKLEILTGRLSETAHSQADPELIYVADGICDVQTDQKILTLQRDQMILINTGKSHAVRIAEDKVLVCRLLISYDALCCSLQEDYIAFQCNSAMEYRNKYNELLRILQEILLDYADCGETEGYKRRGLYNLLLHELTQNFKTSGITSGIPSEWETDRKLSVILSYIHRNYDRTVNLSDIAEKLFVSTSTLSRFFVKATGESIVSYVRKFRLQKAAEAIVQTDEPITRIAAECGFSGASAMSADFKALYGVTPKEYRRNHRKTAKEQGTSVQQEEEKRQRVRETLDAAQRQRDNGDALKGAIRVDVRDYESYRKYENMILNAGTAYDLEGADLREQVLKASRSLHTEYIRIWSPFSERLMIMKDGCAEVNFGRLDGVLDFCVKNNLKIFLELNSRTVGFAANADTGYNTFEEGIEFSSRQQWEDVLEQFILHIRKRYGYASVSTWIFEFTFFLNERPYYISDHYSSRQVWESGYEIVKRYIPDAKVAGPGTPVMLDEGLMRRIIYSFMDVKHPPDIFTAFHFPYHELLGLEGHRPTTETDFLKKQIELVRQILEERNFSGAYFVTDWNVSISGRNYIQDSCYRGTFILDHALNNYESVDGMGVFMASDLSNRYNDSDMILMGGSGIISKDGLCKPAFYAYQFLISLGEYLLKKGRSYVITRNRDDEIRILCYNTRNLGANYFLAQENSYRPDELGKLFRNHEHLRLTVLLEHLDEDRTYIVRQKIINEEEGSVLDKWAALGCEKDLFLEDIRYLQHASVPAVRIERTKAVRGNLRLEIDLAPHEMRWISVVGE